MPRLHVGFLEQAPEMQAAYQQSSGIVRDTDRDRYLAALFLPEGTRPSVLALYAFNAELAQVRDRADQPLAGEVRLQWWREAILGNGQGESGTNPVLTALLDTARRHELPPGKLTALIEARMFDLYNEPMPSLLALENYLASTASTVFELASRIAGKNTEISTRVFRNAGLAYGITGLLRCFPLHASRGQIFIPAEILAKHGVPESDVPGGRSGSGLNGALAEMREIARANLNAANEEISGISPAHRLIFLPLALAESYLSRMERPDYDPFRTPVEIAQMKRQWILWRAARKAR